MKRFAFYQDCKYSIWYRGHFEVEAETYEAAVEILKKNRDEDIHDQGSKEVIPGSCEIMTDTATPLYPGDNLNYSTRKVYNAAGEKICQNGTKD